MTSLPSIEYDLEQLTKDLIELMTQLSDKRQREIGWIETAHARVQYNDPKITNEVRESTRELSSALCVLYFVVMIESYFPNTYIDSNKVTRNLWEEAQVYGWLWSSELDILRAYRHVRHSFAHNSDGTRAKQNRASFDRVLKSNHKLPAISTDEDRIVVNSGASIHMVNEIHAIIGNVISRLNSSPRFGAKQPQ